MSGSSLLAWPRDAATVLQPEVTSAAASSEFPPREVLQGPFRMSNQEKPGSHKRGWLSVAVASGCLLRTELGCPGDKWPRLVFLQSLWRVSVVTFSCLTGCSCLLVGSPPPLLSCSWSSLLLTPFFLPGQPPPLERQRLLAPHPRSAPRLP